MTKLKVIEKKTEKKIVERRNSRGQLAEHVKIR